MISERDLVSQYRQHLAPLYGYVAKRTGGDRALSEDLVQETWLRALADWRRNGLPREPLAWLTTVASNLLASYYRRLRLQRRPGSDPLDGEPVASLRSLEAAALLHLALERLRPKQAWLIEAFHIDGKAIADIADELGISERAAEGRMRRARAALRAQLDGAQ